MDALTQTILWYFNTAFNILEFFIIIWVIRDRRILIISLKRLAETVHALSHIQPTHKPHKEQKVK